MPVVFKYNGYRFFFYSNEGATGTRPYSRQERRICGKILDTATDKRCRGLRDEIPGTPEADAGDRRKQRTYRKALE